MFDTPKTKALKALIAAEGPDGTGRIVGLSIEGEDGVFIYTDSAQWCDDSGAGTFRGDSETQAVAIFKARVMSATANAAEETDAALKAGNAPGLAVTEFATDPRESAIAPSATHSTVYESDAARAKPVGTVSRPARGDSDCLFTLHATDGRLVKTWARMPTLNAVRQALGAWAEAKAWGSRFQTVAEAREDAAAWAARADSQKGRGNRFPAGSPGRSLARSNAALAMARHESSVARADHIATVTAEDTARAKAEGAAAFEAGESVTANPYSLLTNASDWHAGYVAAAEAAEAEPRPFRVALVHASGRDAFTTVTARSETEAREIANAEHGPEYNAQHAWPDNYSDAGKEARADAEAIREGADMDLAEAAHETAQCGGKPMQPGEACPGCGQPLDAEAAAYGECWDCCFETGKTAAPDETGPEIAAEAEPSRRAGQGGAFPLWAAAVERTARAIDSAIDLGLYDDCGTWEDDSTWATA